MRNKLNKKVAFGLTLAVLVALILAPLVLASDVDVAVVDVTVPTNSVTLAPGGECTDYN